MQSTEFIWSSFHKELFGYIRHSIKDDEASRDVLQDVFVKIHLKRDMLKDDNKLVSWVWQITRNTVLDHFKAQKPYTELNESLPAPATERNMNIEFAQRMEPFIRNLSADYQQAIRLVDIQGISQRQFAEIAGISYTAAKSRVQRARIQLKKLFLQCCLIPTDRYGNILDMIPRKNCSCSQRPNPERLVS